MVVVAVVAAVIVVIEVVRVLSGSSSSGNRASTACAGASTNMYHMCAAGRNRKKPVSFVYVFEKLR